MSANQIEDLMARAGLDRAVEAQARDAAIAQLEAAVRNSLNRLPSTKTGRTGERLIPLPAGAVGMLNVRRSTLPLGVEPVFPDAFGGWRDPDNLRHVWREVRQELPLEGLVSHTDRETADILEAILDAGTGRSSPKVSE